MAPLLNAVPVDRDSKVVAAAVSNGTNDANNGYKVAKTIRSFECDIPFRPSNFPKVTEPLPFPSTLKEVLGWTDAYLSRVAKLSLENEAVRLCPII